LEEHSIARRLDAQTQGVTSHEVVLGLEQDRLRNLEGPTLPPLLDHDADVDAVSSRRLGEVRFQTVRYPSRQLTQQSAL
jgi:hypothetical protein